MAPWRSAVTRAMLPSRLGFGAVFGDVRFVYLGGNLHKRVVRGNFPAVHGGEPPRELGSKFPGFKGGHGVVPFKIIAALSGGWRGGVPR